jgi:PTH1 family peptidyl-tRNA hydrolase
LKRLRQKRRKRSPLNSPSPLFLIVGLGNPGPRYRYTRHNVGFMVIHRWARALGVRLLSRRFEGKSSFAIVQDREVLLLCPQTFMNLSGKSVRICSESLGVRNEEILVVHDDLDLPLGRVKVARRGGDGGHKGIQSILEHLGTREFSRVKIGIGRPRRGEAVHEFVLSPFYRRDRAAVEAVLQKAVHACELFVSEGTETAMNEINRQEGAGL